MKIEEKPRIEKDGQTNLGFNFVENVEKLGGFSSAEEREAIALQYKRNTKDEIEKFFKVKGKIYHKKDSGELEKVEKWFEKDEYLNAKSPDDYVKGRY
jgi:hypothetical protein